VPLGSLLTTNQVANRTLQRQILSQRDALKLALTAVARVQIPYGVPPKSPASAGLLLARKQDKPVPACDLHPPVSMQQRLSDLPALSTNKT
jgi:hypothetical protein